MDKVADLLVPQEREQNEDKLYGKDAAGTKTSQASSHTPPMKSPLAQGHLQPESSPDEGPKEAISAPADLTGMTGQYVTEGVSNVSEEELKKHGTAVGLASATMASGAVGEQNPHNNAAA